MVLCGIEFGDALASYGHGGVAGESVSTEGAERLWAGGCILKIISLKVEAAPGALICTS